MSQMQRHADSDDETYVTVGRPFERFETVEDVQRAKARRDKDQYVTDKQGRRRFHGAFTGGFSAGYYNTVGSEEGWTPSSFVSSRAKRSEYGGQRPEDFMDEEDFGAHGIAPKIVSAKEQFVQGGGGENRKRPANTDCRVIPGLPPLQNLIVPSKTSVGATLLNAMGWREGQGVGPKVIKYHLQEDPEVTVYTPTTPEKLSKVEEDFLFAPRDSIQWEFIGKDDLHGLDYRGMEERDVLAPVKSTKALYGMSGEAFGTGALEDEDEDENVYGIESMTSYDISLPGEGDVSAEMNFGWTGRETDTWDLSSFAKASKKPTPNKSYPFLPVPRTFIPIHKFIVPVAVASLGKALSSSERCQLLSGSTGSVFGLLSPSDRARLKQAAEQTKAKLNTPHEQPTTDVNCAEASTEHGKTETEWESGRKERMARAATIFKPLGDSLASRFTRSQDQEEPPKSPECDAIQAARASMFGVLTREIQDWYPHRIVCKRFNVPDPYPGHNIVGLTDGKSKERDKNRSISFELTEKIVTTEVNEKQIVEKDENNQGEDTEEQIHDRPPMDLFRTIFAASDSNSSNDEADDDGRSPRHAVALSVPRQSAVHSREKAVPGSQLPGEKRWKDLSIITSHVPLEDSSTLVKQHLELQGKDHEKISSKAALVEQDSLQLSEPLPSYGPSLPPDIDTQPDNHHQMSSSDAHSHSHHIEKHKRSHKKRKKEEEKTNKEYRKVEHKKKKHKHSNY